jgi:drug/metabolite transporter (DMT)-like permease
MLPNALLARAFLGQPVTARFLVGSLIGLAGIALLLVHEAREAPPTGMVGLGVLLTAVGLLAASAANVLQAAEAARKDSLVVLLAWAMLWGTVLDAAYAWLTVGPPVFPESARYWGGVAYLAILGSVVTFPLYFRLIRDLGPGRAAYNGVLVPVVAMGLSTLFEGYRWSALAAFGAVLALAGMVVALRGRAAPPGTP